MRERRTITIQKADSAIVSASAQSGDQQGTVSVDQMLKEQYVFFREEFLCTAAMLGVAVPLDITEDKSGLIQKFLIFSGPKYVFQIVQSNKEQVLLVRAGLSLLNTTMVFLRRMLPETLEHDRLCGKVAGWTSRGQRTLEQQWAATQLMKVCDVMNVSTLTFMFIATPNPIVQSLLLSVLGNLLASSDDAIAQMLQVPSMFSKVSIGNAMPTASAALNGTADSRPLLKRVGSRANNTGEPTDVNASFRLSRMNTMGTMNSMSSEEGLQTQQSQQQQQQQPPEELNTCLSYLISVVLMHKNNHLLLSGMADVIISMTLRANNQLCEVIARTPTCPLPLLNDGHLPDGKGRGKGHLLKQTMRAGAGAASDSIPVNPLGNRVVEWAGLRLLLKFLHSYHTLFPSGEGELSRNESLSNISPRSMQSNHSSHSRVIMQPESTERDGMATLRIRNEYHYAHNRTLLAASVLVAGSLTVAHYSLSLLGVHELFERCGECFFTGDVDTASSHNLLLAGKGASSGQLSSSKLDSSAPGDSLAPTVASLELPGIIINALNTLQMEKATVLRMQSLEESEQNNPKSKEKTLGRPKSSSSPAMGSRRSSEGFGVTRNDKMSRSAKAANRSSSSRKTQRLAPIDFAERSMPRASPARLTQHSNSIQLTHSLQQDFASPVYPVQTEKGSLYVQNKRMDMLRVQSSPTSLEYKAAETFQKDRHAPLHAQRSQDSLLVSSLRAIEQHAAVPILGKAADDPSTDDNNEVGKVDSLFIDRSLFQSTTYSSVPHSQGLSQSLSSGQEQADAAAATMPIRSSMISPNAHGLSAYRDFFSVVPSSPHLPKRINADDAIIVGEDMTRIRNKFRALGQAAVDKTKNDKDGVMVNGKSTVSIEERARKIYAPKRTHYPWEPAPEKDSHGTKASSSAVEQTTEPAQDTQQREHLEYLDKLFDSVDDPNKDKSKSAASNFSTMKLEDDDDTTPAWQQSNQRYDPQQYGLKLDNIDFEEHKLFDNFKPIFDYADAQPSKGDKKNGNRMLDDDDSVHHPPGYKAARFAEEVQQSNDMILG